MKKLARATLNLTLFAIAFCFTLALASFVLSRVYFAQNPFSPDPLAPENVSVISSPQELNETMKRELAGKLLLIRGQTILSVLTGQKLRTLPKSSALITDYNFSPDDRYIIYTRGGEYIEMLDLITGTSEELVKREEFPNSILLGSVTFFPDKRSILFAVFWKDNGDLVRFDLSTRTWERLNVDIPMGGHFGDAMVSPDGQILTKCPELIGSHTVLELCFLDEHGKFIRYLTNENDFWIGPGKLTLDGEWVIYQSHSKLYKIRKDGSNRQEIAPCSFSVGAEVVTSHYVIFGCMLPSEPNCNAFYIADMNGKAFWQLGYIEPVCEQK